MKKLSILLTAIILVLGNVAYCQLGNVISYQKISDTQGNFLATIDDVDRISSGIEGIGDLDGDGVNDLAMGSIFDDDGGTDRGAVYILFLNPDGTVKTHQKISSTQGGFNGVLNDGDIFGSAIANLGDLNNDGVTDIAVGAHEGTNSNGAVWILFLASNGTVTSYQKIDENNGNFNGALDNNDLFGVGIDTIGDLDNDGVIDIAVSAQRDDDGGTNRGAVWVLFMNTNGTVKAEQKISDTQGAFTGILDNDDMFGHAIAGIGDMDGDNIEDIAVVAHHDDDGGTDRGSVYILFLDTDGTVKSHQKISDTQGGFTGTLDDDDRFGISLSSLGDVNNDNITDIAVGAIHDDDGGTNRGAIWILYMNANGTVQFDEKISDTQGGFTGGLDDFDVFGQSVTVIGDLNGGGKPELAVGANGDDDGGTDRGAAWILFFDNCALPIAGFTADTSNGTSVQFNDTSSSATTWNWDFGDFQSSSLQNPLHIYATTGWFNVCLIITDSCGSDTICDSIYVSESVGINQLAIGNDQITIYPNPSDGKFKIEGLKLKVENVEVFDLFGRKVLESHKPEIDMSSYPAGLYIWRVGEARGKVVIE